MTDYMLATIEQKVEALIRRCAQLEREKNELLAKEQEWQEERQRLIEKNDNARVRVEAMINHLKALSSDSEQRAS